MRWWERLRRYLPSDRHGWATLLLWLGLAALLLAFGVLAEDVYDHEGFAFDPVVLGWLHAHATPTLTAFARGLSTIGSPLVLGAAGVLVTLLLLLRSGREALIFGLSAGGAAGLMLAGKAFFGRVRPDLYPHLVNETSASFPSGHAVGGMAFFLALFLSVRRQAGPVWQGLAAWGVALAVLIGASRPYLQVHYPSDVLAGWAFGAAWVLSAHLLLGQRRRRWEARREEDERRGEEDERRGEENGRRGEEHERLGGGHAERGGERDPRG